MAKYHIGIDLHKTVAQVCVLDERGELVEERRVALPDSAAGAELVASLAVYVAPSRIAVEALGCNRWFVNACRARGLDVFVAHPAALELKKSGRKTDRRDAAEIARRLYLGDLDKHARTYYAGETEFGRRKLLRTRHAQMLRRQQTLNEVRALLNAYLLRPPTEVLASKKSLAWLRTLEMPTPELTSSLRIFVDDLEHLIAQIEALDGQIESLALADPKVAAMVETLPSMGALTAATIFYELGDVGRFRRVRQAAAYAGLVPRVSQSGEGKPHHGRLDKRGNAELRWILSQWAVRLLARHAVAQTWAERHRRRLPTNKLRSALARRLLVGVFHMLRTGEEFSLERCLGVRAAA